MAVKERVGTVVSDKMEKTVVVAVETRFPHPIYQKTVSRTTRYKAHDEDNSCRVGDRVRITETRPMSRQKRWAIAEVLSTAQKLRLLKRKQRRPTSDPTGIVPHRCR